VKAVTYVEIDFPVCSLTYGTAPCTAAVGVTGATKCFNTWRTCQDRANYDADVLTLRFSLAGVTDDPVDAIPSLKSVRVTPAVIDPGVSMGQRESVSVSFQDHPHPDTGIDKYLADRSYAPFSQGTFWGKWRARLASLKGAPLRVIRGELGQDLSAMRTWHYVIESTSGPRGESFQVTAKDLLKYADGDRAQAPAISRGLLTSGIDETATSITLSPSGIGSEYPASGKVALGGKEICSFTRSGDVLTLTRAQSNTDAESHDAGEIVQLVLEYSSETPADLIYDLLTTYADVDPAWIPLATWQAEVDQWISRLYSAEIAEPTPVRELVNELIEQIGLVLWADPLSQQIYLTALRPVSSTAELYNEDSILRGSYSATDQPKKRVSQVWTYFNLINPLGRLDDTSNYRSAVALIDPDSTEIEHGGQPAIKKVFSRWIDSANRTAAERLNSLLYARYSTPPRRISWDVFCGTSCPSLGRGARISHWSLQDEEGGRAVVPVQVTSVEYRDDRAVVQAEEMAFTALPDDGRVVVIDVDGFNINLRDIHDQIYGPFDEDSSGGSSGGESVLFVITSNATIGGSTLSAPALDVGDWPESVELSLVIDGAVRGQGGSGGSFVDGQAGGTGIYTRVPIAIENNGTIAGGGGGGGAATTDVVGEPYVAGGGGGAGYLPGVQGFGNPILSGNAQDGDPGTQTAGGAGGTADSGTGGDGGDPGQAGDAATGGDTNGTGGAAGVAVDGDDLITWTLEGTILGARVDV
jgi:hypothetical protein